MKMKKTSKIYFNLLILLITVNSAFPLMSYCQTQSAGVIFLEAKNWSEILAVAKSENKLIFVDVMASWCLPCKKMDQDVYNLSNVGDYINKSFIAVKLQIDTSNKDSDYTRSWYHESELISKIYNIRSLPTLLFFNSMGDLKYVETGYKNQVDFLEVARNALDSNFDLLIKQYRNGLIEDHELLKISLQSKKFKQDSLSFCLARTYKNRLLRHGSFEQNLTPEHVDFFWTFRTLFDINDEIFKYFLSHKSIADHLLHSIGFSKSFTDDVISRYLENSLIRKTKNEVIKFPKWDLLEKKLSDQFDKETAHRIILVSKTKYYYEKKDWNNYIKFNMERIAFEGISVSGIGAISINNFIYDIVFKHSSDRAILEKCIDYMEFILKADPDSYSRIDTYSCVLYKAGHKHKAIEQEENAILIAKKKGDQRSVKEFQDKIDKMKNNDRIWE
ncbi:thioredoxin-related protein [Pedobacter sp. AK017]|uniref:thioredoxin family protein n=1 Tax=Pedobacter sp. AK017 TaxID=2723073 RepID=UPI00160F90CA|nr:thioredoxin family protein [Pedobacter sp. AK017]MBB5441074.1 thioredoxin-related protein [Pedobacter sp. AK017]